MSKVYKIQIRLSRSYPSYNKKQILFLLYIMKNKKNICCEKNCSIIYFGLNIARRTVESRKPLQSLIWVIFFHLIQFFLLPNSIKLVINTMCFTVELRSLFFKNNRFNLDLILNSENVRCANLTQKCHDNFRFDLWKRNSVPHVNLSK